MKEYEILYWCYSQKCLLVCDIKSKDFSTLVDDLKKVFDEKTFGSIKRIIKL